MRKPWKMSVRFRTPSVPLIRKFFIFRPGTNIPKLRKEGSFHLYSQLQQVDGERLQTFCYWPRFLVCSSRRSGHLVWSHIVTIIDFTVICVSCCSYYAASWTTITAVLPLTFPFVKGSSERWKRENGIILSMNETCKINRVLASCIWYFRFFIVLTTVSQVEKSVRWTKRLLLSADLHTTVGTPDAFPDDICKCIYVLWHHCAFAIQRYGQLTVRLCWLDFLIIGCWKWRFRFHIFGILFIFIFTLRSRNQKIYKRLMNTNITTLRKQKDSWHSK